MTFNATLTLPDGSMGLHAAGPDDAGAPALVVLQEIFGVNAAIRQTVAHYAAHGYRAVAPDLFWRQRPGIELDPDDEAGHAAAMEAAQAYGKQPDAAMADLAALVEMLKQRHGTVGVVGYCLGGRMAFLAWLQLDVDAVVSYYGVGLDQLVGRTGAQATPLQMHVGTNDPLIPAAVRESVAAALGGRDAVSLHLYENAGHAFARRGGKTRLAQAAELADQRALAFLDRHLKEQA
ncbi:Carboxymethylenebutenolidase [Pigmentiphaga humi]|uniref:Carboxymethylenebutenolidase n=1 Tax=Pigmentiphaga humi TaxID=2478468 RepID=A0A3P4B5B1_9BURK|nr:dienelactone hydrolase family protein [Pigmentiphaga humi]VCU71483.1 Carboxymethylenebutenolidase [Pigmentiphaga humi]